MNCHNWVFRTIRTDKRQPMTDCLAHCQRPAKHRKNHLLLQLFYAVLSFRDNGFILKNYMKALMSVTLLLGHENNVIFI